MWKHLTSHLEQWYLGEYAEKADLSKFLKSIQIIYLQASSSCLSCQLDLSLDLYTFWDMKWSGIQ